MFSHLSAPNSAVLQPLPHRAVSWFSSIILPSVTSEISKFLHDNYPILQKHLPVQSQQQQGVIYDQS